MAEEQIAAELEDTADPAVEAQDDEQGEQQEELSDDDLAKPLGWRPLEEFNGNPADWIDARAFIQKGNESLPILRDNLKTMGRKFSALERKLDLQNSTHAMNMKAQKTRLETDFDIKLRETVRDGDTEAFDRITAQKSKEMAEFVEPTETQTADDDFAEAFEGFQDRNKWYDTNRAMTDFANAEGGRVRDANPGISPADELRKVEQSVKDAFPQEFGNKNRTRASSVGSGRRPNGGSKKKQSFEAMPADMQQGCRDSVSAGFVKDQKTYVDNYWLLEGKEQ